MSAVAAIAMDLVGVLHGENASRSVRSRDYRLTRPLRRPPCGRARLPSKAVHDAPRHGRRRSVARSGRRRCARPSARCASACSPRATRSIRPSARRALRRRSRARDRGAAVVSQRAQRAADAPLSQRMGHAPAGRARARARASASPCRASTARAHARAASRRAIRRDVAAGLPRHPRAARVAAARRARRRSTGCSSPASRSTRAGAAWATAAATTIGCCRCCAPRAPRVAGAFDLQIVDEVPAAPHDLRVDASSRRRARWFAGSRAWRRRVATRARGRAGRDARDPGLHVGRRDGAGGARAGARAATSASRRRWIGVFVGLLYAARCREPRVRRRFIARYGAIRVSQACVLLCARRPRVAPIARRARGGVALLVLAPLVIGIGYGPITPASSRAARAHDAARRAWRSRSRSSRPACPAGAALAGAHPARRSRSRSDGAARSLAVAAGRASSSWSPRSRRVATLDARATPARNVRLAGAILAPLRSSSCERRACSSSSLAGFVYAARPGVPDRAFSSST